MRNSREQAIRINYVAPCWIKSAIRIAEYEKWLVDLGIEFGEQIDVSSCMMQIATDKSINGRSFMITPRSFCKQSVIDSDREGYHDTPEDAMLKHTQEAQLVTIEDKWLDDYKFRIYKDWVWQVSEIKSSGLHVLQDKRQGLMKGVQKASS